MRTSALSLGDGAGVRGGKYAFASGQTVLSCAPNVLKHVTQEIAGAFVFGIVEDLFRFALFQHPALV